jgi:hypothetical protein
MLRKNLNDLDENGKKGDWCFMNDDQLLVLRFGDDPFKHLTILPIAESAMPGKPHWQWNGSREAPTLTPSILVHAVPNWNMGWHGWLRDGELIDA